MFVAYMFLAGVNACEPNHDNLTDTHADDYNFSARKKSNTGILLSSPVRKERGRHLTYLIKL
ncbi:MAG: hypothetical protein ACOC2E_05480, partial [Bacteroidota bacterium]